MMRRLALLFLCLLLCGCAQKQTVPQFTPSETAVSPLQPELSAPAGHTVEQHAGGAVTVFPANAPRILGIRALGSQLLLFSGEEATVLSLLDKDGHTILGSARLGCRLDSRDPSLQFYPDAFSYYDPVSAQTVIMDADLKELRRISAPEGLVGVPLLTSDHKTMYYCTEAGLRAWEPDTGLQRLVTGMAYDTQILTGLFRNDSLLQCTVSDNGRERVLFLSAENGRQLGCHEGPLEFTDSGSGFGAVFREGCLSSLVFGAWGSAPSALTPAEPNAAPYFLEQLCAAVTISETGDQQILFDYYDLSSGLRRAALTLSSSHYPIAMEDTADGSVYILMAGRESGCDVLYRWDTEIRKVNDTAVYTGPHYTAQAPDTEGLARCRAYAEAIGRRHGISVRIWEDALASAPWDYALEAEHLVPVLERELRLLDERLSLYPEGFFAQTASHFSSLTISLVRRLTGTAHTGSLETAGGIQHMMGRDAHVVIAVGDPTGQALYHELFHVMDTHLLTLSGAFDRWEELNPAGFSYDYDYAANAARDSGIYLQPQSRYFVDTYSMSFPREDRARIMEYAMLPGNEALFQSDAMQRKLKALCDGIREAYGLRESPETFLWEQYLP